MIILVRNEKGKHYKLDTSTDTWTRWKRTKDEAIAAKCVFRTENTNTKTSYALNRWDPITGQHCKYPTIFLVQVLQYDSPIWDI